MDKISAYQKHLQFMQDVHEIGSITEEELSVQFDLLLACLPNGGKLYKYRSLCGKSFKYIYDALANGYMWLPSANSLNDDSDSVLVVNALEDHKRFVNYVLRDHDKLLFLLLQRFGQKYWEKDTMLNCIPFEKILDAFDLDTGSMNNQRMVALFGSYSDGEAKLEQFRKLIQRLLNELQSAINENAKALFLANEESRKNCHVFSMSASYDLGNMWGYYADNGQGFCIKYDFNRAKALGATAMCYLLNTYQVIYSDVPRQYPVELMAELSLFDPNNCCLQEEIKRNILERLLCKDGCWEHEKEWRIVIGDSDCKIPVDIVSSIIIDERSLNKTNAQKLIQLCHKQGWMVKVRKNHVYDTSHSYEELVTKGKRHE